jgi:hypothetical protein
MSNLTICERKTYELISEISKRVMDHPDATTDFAGILGAAVGNSIRDLRGDEAVGDYLSISVPYILEDLED